MLNSHKLFEYPSGSRAGSRECHHKKLLALLVLVTAAACLIAAGSAAATTAVDADEAEGASRLYRGESKDSESCRRYKLGSCCREQRKMHKIKTATRSGVSCIQEIMIEVTRGTNNFPESCCELPMFREACARRDEEEPEEESKARPVKKKKTKKKKKTEEEDEL